MKYLFEDRDDKFLADVFRAISTLNANSSGEYVKATLNRLDIELKHGMKPSNVIFVPFPWGICAEYIMPGGRLFMLDLIDKKRKVNKLVNTVMRAAKKR